MTSFSLDGRSYAARFDQTGRLAARAPLFKRRGDLEWTGTDGSRCYKRGIVFDDFDTVVVVAIIWSGPYELALHVVEPGGRLGGPVGYVFPGRPNENGQTGLGSLETFGAPVPGETRVQLYLLPADRNPRQSEITYFVEFASRGNPAQRPFCGNDPTLIAKYRIIHLDAATAEPNPEIRGGSFTAVACGHRWSEAEIEDGYFVRWKWKL